MAARHGEPPDDPGEPSVLLVQTMAEWLTTMADQLEADGGVGSAGTVTVPTAVWAQAVAALRAAASAVRDDGEL